jgi:hypothetical protein
MLAKPLHVSDLPCTGILHRVIGRPVTAKKMDFPGMDRTGKKGKHDRKNNKQHVRITPLKPANIRDPFKLSETLLPAFGVRETRYFPPRDEKG